MRLCDRLQKTPSEILDQDEEWLDYFATLSNADKTKADMDKPKNKQN